ncbi:MarR family winged helix-turn-helix transcriptional regulator [Paenibacillus rhizophilus]|uniref:MarR family transcriptional regulator n=1 Tax=Paenibacillus rhizophilus TaxID=1850366 RepID=A0A3N9PFA3_9BACL|nr:MarR family transcriptional regulator [Paenibacillus rhizophilus]RQW13714.1 MarR family transcriptional regulator [Paenibacillus rhizophilus]
MAAGDERNFDYLIRSIGIRLKRRADLRLADYGLNSQQGRMISYIASHEEKGIIQKDLERVFQRRGASITSMLQGLEKKGYIERRISAADERQKQLFVLQKGKELIAEFEALFAESEQLIKDGLSEREQEELFRLLGKVDTYIERKQT